MSNLSIYFNFASEVSELFAKGNHAGLSHDQLIKVLQTQLELEQRFKADDERSERFYYGS